MTADQLSLLSQAESFPVHLMRASWDGSGDTRTRTGPSTLSAKHSPGWATLGRQVLSAAARSQPSRKYRGLPPPGRGGARMPMLDQLRALVEGLPFGHIEEIMWRWPPPPSPPA